MYTVEVCHTFFGEISTFACYANIQETTQN